MKKAVGVMLFLGLLVLAPAAGQQQVRACEGQNLDSDGRLALSISDGPVECDKSEAVWIGDIVHVEFKAMR